MGSDSGSESGFPDNPQQDDDDDDSLDELEFEEKLQIKDADRTREALNGVHQNGGGLPSSSSFNGQQGFLASFFEAKTPATAGSEKKPLPSSSKKFAKKSQKERKKELDLLSKEGPVEPEKQQAKKWSGWGTQSPATPEKQQQPPANGLRRDLSLSEIMKAEVISPPPPPSVQSALNAPSSSSQSSVGGTKPKIKKSSWKQLSFTEPEPKGLSSAPAVNPWKKVAAASTTPASKDCHVSSSSSTDFKNILKDEVRQTANLVRAKSKSLEVTQLEEKAIQELLVFYNAKHVTDETIRVERVDEGPLATPVWNKSSIRY